MEKGKSMDGLNNESLQKKNIPVSKKIEIQCSPKENVNGSAIKSITVVKKSQVPSPVSFRQLQSNTDLKTPPSNWLQDQLFNATLSSKQSEFTSFIMGYQFPDCIGEVDIVSDAENIKKLLKIPYNPNTHVSMMVHRIAKTLLIDEFDVSRLILQQHTEGSWKWLQHFFSDFVLKSLASQDSVIVRPNKSRDVVRNKNLMSKFLHHSLLEEEEQCQPPKEEGSPVSYRTMASKQTQQEPSGELAIEEHLPEATIPPFARNIIWNFEDVRMLIGTDLPIFGGGNYPCISLKLKDMNKPISVLTGIDNWLDNLMCNVPEVMMCYHMDGLVQKYEMIKTEDLPNVKDCQFSPQLVRDIAHNILSFLKRKSTKEGHTYWLFKGKNDDIVKLYDLTSLCKEGLHTMNEENNANYNIDEDNPFTVPVAMLFYSVARNLYNGEEASSNCPTIRTLLHNVLNLLSKEKYFKIHCQSNFILSDIYLPSTINPNEPLISQDQDLDDDDVSLDNSEPEDAIPKKKKKDVPSIKVSSLTLPHVSKLSKQKQGKPTKLPRDISERCELSLKHAIEGLATLQIDKEKETEKPSFDDQSQSDIIDEPIMAQTMGTIPMPPIPPKEPKQEEKDPPVESKAIVSSATILTEDSLTSKLSEATWHEKMTFKFLRKVALVFMIEAKLEYDNKRYGGCLRHVKLALHAWYGLRSLLRVDSQFPLPSQPLVIAGNAYYFLFKNWPSAPSHIEQFNSRSKNQQVVAELLDSIIPGQDCNWLIKAPIDAVDSLKLSFTCFESASVASPPDKDLKKKLASTCNELACAYMGQGQELCQELESGVPGALILWEDSQKYLKKALTIFEQLKDNMNIALILCNQGRLFRLCAFYNAETEPGFVYSPFIKNIYKQSFNEYENALGHLKEKNTYIEDVRDHIMWEFSSALYTYGVTLLDDMFKNDQEMSELNRQVSDIFNRALKLCCDKRVKRKEPLRYLRRELDINYRLGQMNADFYERSNGESKYEHLADVYHKRSCSVAIKIGADVLRPHLSFIDFIDKTIKRTKSSWSNWKQYTIILNLIYDCIPSLKQSGATYTSEELEKFDAKIKSILKEMVRLTKSEKSLRPYEELCKSIYRMSLSTGKPVTTDHILKTLAEMKSTKEKLSKAK